MTNADMVRREEGIARPTTIQEMKAIDGGTNLGTILLKGSILQGAIAADFEECSVQAAVRANAGTRRSWEEFNI